MATVYFHLTSTSRTGPFANTPIAPNVANIGLLLIEGRYVSSITDSCFEVSFEYSVDPFIWKLLHMRSILLVSVFP